MFFFMSVHNINCLGDRTEFGRDLGIPGRGGGCGGRGSAGGRGREEGGYRRPLGTVAAIEVRSAQVRSF